MNVVKMAVSVFRTVLVQCFQKFVFTLRVFQNTGQPFKRFAVDNRFLLAFLDKRAFNTSNSL